MTIDKDPGQCDELSVEVQSGYGKEYTETGFWTKVTSYAKSIGKDVLEYALCLYYALQSPATPKWAKGVITGALGYFILPADAIADFIPAVGYADDLGVLAWAIAAVACSITPEIREKARKKLEEWFKG